MSTLSAYHLKKLDDLLNEGGYTPLIASSNAEFSAFFNNLGLQIIIIKITNKTTAEIMINIASKRE